MNNSSLVRPFLRRARQALFLSTHIALCAAFCICGSSGDARAQLSNLTLLTEPNSTRAIAVNSLTLMREPFTETTQSPLTTDTQTRVVLFALNFDLMTGDALTSLKVEGEDGARRRISFPVERILGAQRVWQLSTIALRDHTQSGDGRVS